MEFLTTSNAMNLQKGVQKNIISVMKYTNVSTRFHYLNIENFNNTKHKINRKRIHYLMNVIKRNLTENPKTNLSALQSYFKLPTV